MILSILNVISSHGELGITKIMLEANLPHERAEDYLEKLKEEGYIKTKQESGRDLYIITDEGREFLRSLKWTKSFFDNLGFPL